MYHFFVCCVIYTIMTFIVYEAPNQHCIESHLDLSRPPFAVIRNDFPTTIRRLPAIHCTKTGKTFYGEEDCLEFLGVNTKQKLEAEVVEETVAETRSVEGKQESDFTDIDISLPNTGLVVKTKISVCSKSNLCNKVDKHRGGCNKMRQLI
jgi:hypothetical protein